MNPKVLIVEDNEVISEQLRLFLKRYEYESIVFHTGEDALDNVKQYNPDIVLMDIKLAGSLDGIETTKRMKQIGDYPVLFLTSHTELNIIEKIAATEPAGFVSKSISHSELKVQIDYIFIKNRTLREQREIIEDLETSTKKYESIFNSSRDAIFYLDSNFIVSFWNPSAEKIFGYSAQDAKCKSIVELLFQEEDRSAFMLEFESWLADQAREVYHKTMVTRVCNRNGDCFLVEFTFGVVDSTNNSVCGFARDVTEKIDEEEELSKFIEEMQITKEMIEQNASEVVMLNAKLYESEAQLQELNASKDKFFSIIAHDLKGPFQGLLGYSSLLTSDLNEMSLDEISELGENLNQSANNLFKLLENLLSWSRIQRGAIECNPIDFELSLLSSQNIDLIKARASQKELEIITNVPDDIYVFADVNMLNTILRNLLSNSIKFTPRGGKIELSAKEVENKIEITIKDSGVGMSEDMLNSVFRIDAYVSTPGTDNEQGTGLGLVLCKDLVEKNDGIIECQSTVGEGTTFSLLLPKGSPQSYED